MRRAIQVVFMLSALLLTAVLTVSANVDLNYFRGDWIGDSVHLEWQTASELDSAGFFVWRSTEDLPIVNGQIDQSRATRLEPVVTNPDGPCGVSGRTYTFVDNTIDPGRSLYHYYLQSIACEGDTSSFDGDSSNTGLDVARHRLLLPHLSKNTD